MTTRRTQKAIGVGVVLLAAMVQTGLAVDCYWTNYAASGEFATSSNWKNGVVPGIADKAFFTNRSAYTVSVSTRITNNFLNVYGGTVTFDTPGSNYTVTNLNVGNLADAGAFTNTLIISNGSTVTVVSGQCSINIKDATKAGNYHLKVLSGARIAGAPSLYIGGYVNRVGDTNTLTVDGAGSRIDFTSITMSANALNQLCLTNGGTWGAYNSNYHLYLNQGVTPNKVLKHVSRVVIGGGTPESVANVGMLTLNAWDGTPATFEIQPDGVAKTNTSELVLLQNGVVSARSYVRNYSGGTITLDGGRLTLIEGGASGVLLNSGTIQGSGEIRLAKNGALQNITLSWVTNTTGSVTNYGVIAPGIAASPGTLVISNYANNAATLAYMEIRPRCRLKFDLAGATPPEYDRILCTNMNVYLGSYASPYTVQGGAIIDVTLTNNYLPANGATFDLLSARDIVDVSLAPVTFNLPTQPPGAIWTPSIVTNGSANEILRLSVQVPSNSGTMIFIN